MVGPEAIIDVPAPCPECGGRMLAARTLSIEGFGPVAVRCRIESVFCTGCGLAVKLPL